jgi:hypothetical protein
MGLIIIVYTRYCLSFSFLFNGPKQMVITSVETGEFLVSINLTNVELRKHMISARTAIKTIIPMPVKPELGYLATQIYASEVINRFASTIIKANRAAKMYEQFEVSPKPDIEPEIEYQFLDDQFVLMELAFNVLPYSISFDKTNNPDRSENITTNLLLLEIFHQTELLENKLDTLLDSISEIKLNHPVSYEFMDMLRREIDDNKNELLFHDSYTLTDIIRKDEVLYATIQFSSNVLKPMYTTTIPVMYDGISLPFNIYIDTSSKRHHFLHCVQFTCQESYDHPDCSRALDSGNTDDIISTCPKISNLISIIFEEEDLLVTDLSAAEIHTINNDFEIQIEKQPAVLNLIKPITIRGNTYDIFSTTSDSTTDHQNTVKYSILTDEQVERFTAKQKLTFVEYVREHLILSISVLSIGSAFVSLNLIKCISYTCHTLTAPSNYKKAVYEFITHTLANEMNEPVHKRQSNTQNREAILKPNSS